MPGEVTVNSLLREVCAGGGEVSEEINKKTVMTGIDGLELSDKKNIVVPQKFDLNDTGLATWLVALYGASLVYIPGLDWHSNDGTRWMRDDENMNIRRKLKSVAQAIKQYAATMSDSSKAKAIFNWAVKAGNVDTVSRACRAAETMLCQSADQFDTYPWKINFLNGTLDLETGESYKQRPEDKLTQRISLNWLPDAKAPIFDRFLKQIFPDRNVRAFVKRAIGYTLTGKTGEQVLFFCHGGGANGKSTFLEVFMHCFGEYAGVAPSGMLLSSYKDIAPWDLLSLKGLRLVVSQETPEGRPFNETLIKQLTGGDTFTARAMHSGTIIKITPTFTLWLCSNHKPRVKGTDDAIWRRILLIPFEVQIAPENRDPELKEKLKAEAEGILAWAVEGAKEYLRDGLNPPDSVKQASQEYRNEEDLVLQWFNERVSESSGGIESSTALFNDFTRFWQQAGERRLPTQAVWGKRMATLGFTSKHTKRGKVYHGVKLNTVSDDLPDLRM